MKFYLNLKIIALFLLNQVYCYLLTPPTVQIKMEEVGMHRKLMYTVKNDNNILGEKCEYLINQPLPAAVYISTDDLDDLSRMNKLSAVYPKFINIEAFTTKAQSFTVIMRGFTKDLTLPIHFRYHASSEYRTKSWVTIIMPKLYFNCFNGYNKHINTDRLNCPNLNEIDFEEPFNSTESKGCVWQQVHEGYHLQEPLHVEIPVGDANGYIVVMYVTISLSWTASMWIVLRIHFVSSRIKNDLSGRRW